MIKLLIADDNKDFDINLFNLIKQYNSDIHIVGISVNGLETYEKIKLLKPDIVLLDIQMPILNGFQVIQKLASENTNVPQIILITAHYELLSCYNSSNLIYGVLLKPIDFSNLSKVLDSIICDKGIEQLNDKVVCVLSAFDFNVKSKGYRYLVECIKSGIVSPYLMNNLEKKLYPYIAKHFIGTTPSKIKWAVDKSINSMYRYTNKEILNKFFPSLKKLSTKYFIETIISKINKR